MLFGRDVSYHSLEFLTPFDSLMANLNKDGKIIISAKEVASYLHCPESWNLTYLKESGEVELPNQQEKLEKELWLADFDSARYLTWATNLIIFMIFFLVIIYFLTQIV